MTSCVGTWGEASSQLGVFRVGLKFAREVDARRWRGSGTHHHVVVVAELGDRAGGLTDGPNETHIGSRACALCDSSGRGWRSQENTDS